MLKRFMKALAYSPAIYGFAETLERLLPPLRYWHRAQYQRHFDKLYKYERLFQGVYPDPARALLNIPKNRPVGYNNSVSAVSLGRGTPMLPSEYPIIYWLSRILPQSPTILDLGGYLGLSYDWYKKYDIYPANLRWTIYDVPAVVEEGRRMLEREPGRPLRFTTDFAEASTVDVLLASGSLQFCEEPLADMLSRLEKPPAHLLINKLAAHVHRQFYTLQNMGPSIAPYRVVRRADFVQSLEDLGYQLVDSWQNPELTCYIPFHPDETVEAFDGFYFRRNNAGSALHSDC
jgi:putative methyltransferase (TIGR04325 family)